MVQESSYKVKRSWKVQDREELVGRTVVTSTCIGRSRLYTSAESGKSSPRRRAPQLCHAVGVIFKQTKTYRHKVHRLEDYSIWKSTAIGIARSILHRQFVYPSKLLPRCMLPNDSIHVIA